MLNRLRLAARTLLLMAGCAALLAVLVNIAAAALLDALPYEPSLWQHILTPQTDVGVQTLQRIHGVRTPAEALARHALGPHLEMHPSLHFMTERTNNALYRVGIEGIRYDPGWEDEDVRHALEPRARTIALMGGSTTFGFGAAGNETISWYLNRGAAKPGGIVALNFGVPGYDLQREIEKLAALLRGGYRPHMVVFLDGWNDLADLPRSNMRWQDRVVFHGFSEHRGEIAFTPATATRKVNYWQVMTESLPVTQLVRAWRREKFGPANVIPDRDPYRDGFDFAEADWMWLNGETFAKTHQAVLEQQLIEAFRHNVDFVESLSRAFGFQLFMFLQPIGLFDPTNPFVTDAARQFFTYGFYKNVELKLRSEIAEGRLRMIDASDALSMLEGDRYVDAAHYSPKANAALAKYITRVIEAGGSGR